MRCLHPETLLLFILLPDLHLTSFSSPFLLIWNAPSSACHSQFGIDLDLEVFNIVHNANQTFMGEKITIFYSDKLGLYPQYSNKGIAVNGGVPQNGSLGKHLRVSRDDINTHIPDVHFRGLGVVDWESWRPVWERNWDSKVLYWEGSEALVRSRHPDWSPERVQAAALVEFTKAGREFMEETVKLGEEMRPRGLWGYYGFPGCYNYYKSSNYTGECPAVERRRNDELVWLWNVSSALFPDIYLSLEMRELGDEVLLYTYHRVQEALRVAAQALPPTRPTYPYARIVYTYTLDFLSLEHLVYTIGESAALGAAGVVLWGDNPLSKTKANCEALKSYIDSVLGPYAVNLTSATALCSRTMCSSQGRCRRRDPKSTAYLHLDPAEWKLVSDRKRGGRGRVLVIGEMSASKAKATKSEFECECFPGWTGEDCSQPSLRR